MKTRQQIILETVRNLMEIIVEFGPNGERLPSRPAPIFRNNEPWVNPAISALSKLGEMIPKRPGYNPYRPYPRLPPSRRPDIGPSPGAQDGFGRPIPPSRRPGRSDDLGPKYPRLPPSKRPDIGPDPRLPSSKIIDIGPDPRLPSSIRPDIGPGDGSYTPTPKRPGVGIEPKWPRVGNEEKRRRQEQIVRPEDRPAGAYRPTKRIPYT